MNRFFIKAIFKQKRLNKLIHCAWQSRQTEFIKHEKFDDKIQADLLQNKTLRPMNETKIIQDYDDKFGLKTVRDPNVIMKHLVNANFNYRLSDLIHFVRKISEICDHNYFRNKDFQMLLQLIKKKLKNNDHETYPYIGSLSYYLNNMGVKDKELWTIFEQKINNDQWYTNFQESIFVMQAFSDRLQNSSDMDRIDTLFKKVERIVMLTTWETNMLYYKIIVESLVKVQRFNSLLFPKIENHVLNNLSMTYDVDTIVDILFAYAKADKGGLRLYDALQYTIAKGHLFNSNFLMQSRILIPFSGKMTGKLLEIYARVDQKFPEYQIYPDFRSLVYKVMVNKKTTYELPDIISNFEHMHVFNYEEKEEIEQTIFHKIPEIQNISIQEVIDFYGYFDQKIEQIPQSCINYLENKTIQEFRKYINPENIIYYSQSLLLNPHFRPKQELLGQIGQYLDTNFQTLDSNQIYGLLSILDENHIQISNKRQINDFLLISKYNNGNNQLEQQKRLQIE